MADRFRTPKKEKQWDAIPSFTEVMTANATFLTARVAFSSVQTVLRMIGEYIITPTSAPTALDQCVVAVGICKMSTDASTVGATAAPDPAGEAEYPWLYWASHKFYFGGTGAEPSAGPGAVRKSFDIRSMRKFRPGESLVFVTQYVDIAGLPPMTFSAGETRILTTIH